MAKIVQAASPTSYLLEIKIGEEISDGQKSGVVEAIDFEESNTFWEIIFSLNSSEKIYIRKYKTTC